MRDIARFYQRHADTFHQGAGTLYVDPPPEAGLPPDTSTRCFTQDFAAWRQLAAAGRAAQFGTFPGPDDSGLRQIVLRLPREKALLDAWLHWSARALAPPGVLWLAGENRAGIRSASTRLGRYFGQVGKEDTARHCALFRASAPLPGQPFDEESLYTQWHFEARGRRFAACSAAGVFAHARLDPGTALLLQSLDPGSLDGSVLDFGCGAGVIATVLQALKPALRTTLADSSALALAASRRTLTANGLDATILASDGFSEVSGAFDLVVSNPPFHQGVDTDPEMSMKLLAQVRNFLRPSGQLVLVANRHLPYGQWLVRLFGHYEELAADNHYQVLRARMET